LSTSTLKFDYPSRVRRLQAAMEEQGVDVALLSVGADLPYLTGYEAMATERLTVLVVRREGDPVLLIPELEAPRLEPGVFEILPWGETEDPIALAAEVAGSPDTVAVADRMWSVFLLGFQKAWTDAEWLAASELTAPLRMHKDSAEIEALRSVAHAIDRVMARLPREVRFSGRTEREVARDAAELILAEGHEVAEFTIIASGPNGASPHHEPGERVIGEGDMVVCDLGGRIHSYFSDSTRTFVVGEPTARQREVHAVVIDANAAGREAVAPGIPCEEIDRAARKVIADAGYGEFFVLRTGHGFGLVVHEHPYMVEGNTQPL
jgi:Xaa-Pro aminopeptidase